MKKINKFSLILSMLFLSAVSVSLEAKVECYNYLLGQFDDGSQCEPDGPGCSGIWGCPDQLPPNP